MLYINENTTDKNITIEDLKLLKSETNKRKKEIMSKYKNNKCYICGKEAPHCNSHKIPQFILKNLNGDGHYDIIAECLNISRLAGNKGTNNLQTFDLICRDCDNKIFDIYEDEEKLNGEITEDMLNKIALKNLLYDFYIFRYYYESNIKFLEENTDNLMEHFKQYSANDIQFYMDQMFNRHFNAIRTNSAEKHIKTINDDKYELIRIETLPYRVPIAFQGCIVPYKDYNCKILNDVNTINNKTIYNFLHICVFPLSDKTKIFMFCKKSNTEFENFKKQINILNIDGFQDLILYYITLYSDDLVISKDIKHKKFVFNKLRDFLMYDGTKYRIYTTQGVYCIDNKMENLRNIQKMNFPKILSENYKLC